MPNSKGWGVVAASVTVTVFYSATRRFSRFSNYKYYIPVTIYIYIIYSRVHTRCCVFAALLRSVVVVRCMGG